MSDQDPCLRCTHPRQRHWPDDQRSQPGCHVPGCYCSWDPDEVDRAREARQLGRRLRAGRVPQINRYGRRGEVAS